MRSGPPIFFWQKYAAQGWPDAKRIEEVVADGASVQTGCFARTGQCKRRSRLVGSDGLENAGQLLVSEKVWFENRSDMFARVFVGDPNEARGITVGKRAKQNGVHNGEDRACCADAEGQGENCDCCEASVLAQHSEAEIHILAKYGEPVAALACAGFLFDGFEAAEVEVGAAAGFFGGSACGDVIRDLTFEMEAEFVVEMFLGLLFAEETKRPVHKATPTLRYAG